jgi:hypothetical protein
MMFAAAGDTAPRAADKALGIGNGQRVFTPAIWPFSHLGPLFPTARHYKDKQNPGQPQTGVSPFATSTYLALPSRWPVKSYV